MSNNCICSLKNNKFCLPKIDYNNLYKDENGRYNDFRLCPLRFLTTIYLIEQLEIKYSKFSSIKTENERIKMFKQILTKEYKLSKDDCKFILSDYLNTEENLLNNKTIIECDECWKEIDLKKDKYQKDDNENYLCKKCFIQVL